MKVIIRPNASSATELTARIIAKDLRANPKLVLGLATGRTMESVYALLADMHRGNGLDFSLCRTFNLDEYVGLAADDPNSYRFFMNNMLFSRVNVDLRNTLLPNGMAADLEAEGRAYEDAIIRTGGIDLQVLGIGENGHIGFNEPLSPLSSRTRAITLTPTTLNQNAGLFAGGKASMPRRAMTMGIGTILDSRRCLLLAMGASKAQVIAQAIEGPVRSMIPASALQLHQNCVIILDQDAAAGLKAADDYKMIFENDPEWKEFRK